MFPGFRAAPPNHNPVGRSSPDPNDYKMKTATLPKLFLSGLALALAVTGCQKNPHNVTDIPGRTENPPKDEKPMPPVLPVERPITEMPHPPNSNEPHVGWIEDAAIFKAYTVHFDLDSSVVKAADKANVQAVAEELKAHPAWAVRVEGYCDERGTEEYNRSLGERRALALREQLISLGIDPSRVDTISFGKDRPADPGHDETAWKQNRRGEFILETPPK